MTKYQSLHWDERGMAFQVPFNDQDDWQSRIMQDPDVVWAHLIDCASGERIASYHRDMAGKKSDWVVTVRRTIVEKLYCPDCTREEAFGDPDGHSSSIEEIEDSETIEVLDIERETENDA